METYRELMVIRVECVVLPLESFLKQELKAMAYSKTPETVLVLSPERQTARVLRLEQGNQLMYLDLMLF